jgi:hypothetical protein
MSWPFITKKQFEEYTGYWVPTTAKKQKNKIKYTLWWNSAQGGVWVREE